MGRKMSVFCSFSQPSTTSAYGGENDFFPFFLLFLRSLLSGKCREWRGINLAGRSSCRNGK